MDNLKKKFRPPDIALLIYILTQFLFISLFMTGKPGWYFFLMFYAAAAAIAVIFALFPLREAGIFWRALRMTYPFFLIIFFYEAVGPQVSMIFKQPFDGRIVALENMIFGADPAFAIQRYMEIWLNELMSFAYISYYFIIPAAAIILIVKKRWISLERLTLAISIAFYLSYLMFIIFPVVGPRFYLADHYYLPLIGPVFASLAKVIVDYGGFYGGAMPSSHCAVTLVAVGILSREIRKLRLILIAFLALLCASTVYGRYHYLSDVVMGLAVGWLALKLSKAWLNGYLSGINGKTGEQSFFDHEAVEIAQEQDKS